MSKKPWGLFSLVWKVIFIHFYNYSPYWRLIWNHTHDKKSPLTTRKEGKWRSATRIQRQSDIRECTLSLQVHSNLLQCQKEEDQKQRHSNFLSWNTHHLQRFHSIIEVRNTLTSTRQAPITIRSPLFHSLPYAFVAAQQWE